MTLFFKGVLVMRSVVHAKTINKKTVRNTIIISTALLFSACSPLSSRLSGPTGSEPVYPLAASFVTNSSSPATKSQSSPPQRVTSRTLSPIEDDVRDNSVKTSAPKSDNKVIVVRDGDTLLGVARKQEVDAVELAELNGIEAPYELNVGDELVLPGSKTVKTAKLKRKTPTRRIAGNVAKSKTKRAAVKNKKSKLAKVTTPHKKAGAQAKLKKTVKKPVKTASAQKPLARKKSALKRASIKQPERTGNSFRWPLRGRVISEFGAKPDGTRNDGINLSVPRGAAIVAAENGTVVYSGNELKGFGNLLLIRHKNGWSTAYAHISEMLVKNGQTVRRGQVIAKAGQTGAVSRPQLHFEIRRGTDPVNPRKLLSGSRLALRQ